MTEFGSGHLPSSGGGPKPGGGWGELAALEKEAHASGGTEGGRRPPRTERDPMEVDVGHMSWCVSRQLKC